MTEGETLQLLRGGPAGIQKWNQIRADDRASTGPIRPIWLGFQGINFAGADLRGADLRRTTLAWSNFAGADLRGADLREAVLTGANLQNARLQNANLLAARLDKADFSSAVLYGAIIEAGNLRSISVGWANYPFREPLTIVFSFGKRKATARKMTVEIPAFAFIHNLSHLYWIAQTEHFPFAGVGLAQSAAQRSWREQFHAHFQRLFVKRPWERTAAEQTQWAKLEQLVDVAAYRQRTPYTIRQIGTLVELRPARRLVPRVLGIEWMSGQRERVRLRQAPPDFAACALGQRLEALVLRDAASERMRKILEFVPLGTPSPTEVSTAKWDELPTSRQLPAKSWDQYH
jgi:hypothetical protein